MLGFFPEIFKGKGIAGNRIHEFAHSFDLMVDICDEEYSKPEYASLLHDYLLQEEKYWDSCIDGFELCYNNGNYQSFEMSFDVKNQILRCLRLWIDAEKEYFFNEYFEILKTEKVSIDDFNEIVTKPSLNYSGGNGGLSFSYSQWLCMMIMQDKNSVNEDVCYFIHYTDNYFYGFTKRESADEYRDEIFEETKEKALKIMQGAFRFHIETLEPNVWKYKDVILEL